MSPSLEGRGKGEEGPAAQEGERRARSREQGRTRSFCSLLYALGSALLLEYPHELISQ
jgi:hypothetical protein